ncbi:MAG TPA: DUF3794 domain-containing protein [Candidatus Blautia merdipullorum]|nr:DUF3794 domain-containing protein [Candidatus Blautia merdipullorum]
MELITKKMHMLERKCQAVSQVTFDEDMNVPDVKPDMGRMIQKKGSVQIEDIQISEGKAYIAGALQVYILYVSDSEERNIESLMGTLPLGENLNLEGLENGDKVQLKWEIEDLTVHIINSRKLNIKALVTFRAYGEEIAETELPIGVEDGDISQKKEEISVMGAAVHKKDTMRVKEDISLASNKPDIYQLLWNTVEIRGVDIRTEQDKIGVKGELFVFVLYRGNDDNNSLQWLEHSLPFYQELECPGCSTDMIPNVEVSMAQSDLKVKQDEDGEERRIGIDAVLELEMNIYEEEELSLLLDVYTPARDCQAVREEKRLESLLVKNFSKCKVSDRVKAENSQGKILQICHSDGNVKIDDTSITERGILVEGIVQVRILYIVSDDEMPFYSMETMIPFTHLIEAPGISQDCTYHLRADLEQLSTTMIDSDEIEVKIIINLNALVLKGIKTGIIRGIEERELDREKLSSMPGIVGYQVQPGDTLWDIAKKFYTTIDTITQLNHLEDREIRPRDTLILMKKVEG